MQFVQSCPLLSCLGSREMTLILGTNCTPLACREDTLYWLFALAIRELWNKLGPGHLGPGGSRGVEHSRKGALTDKPRHREERGEEGQPGSAFRLSPPPSFSSSLWPQA